MSTTQVLTGVVGVNAAFLREIKEDNRDLRQLIRRATRLIASPDKVLLAPGTLRELIAALRDQVGFHFSLEEAYGYFDQTWGTPPEFAPCAERLRAQHLPLYQQVCHLAQRSDRQLSDDPADERRVEQVHTLLRSLAYFLNRLHHHESAENQLIFDAIDQDTGVGD